MVERLSYRIVPMPHPLIYEGAEEEVKDFIGLNKEFDDFQDIVNENYKNAWEAVRNLYEYEDRAVDPERLPEKQHKYVHFTKDGLRPETCDWQWKPFISDLMFWTTAFGGQQGWVLNWAQNGIAPAASTIWWSPYEDGVGSSIYTSTINAGFQALPGLGANLRYMYIESRQTIAPYVPITGTHTLSTTLNARTAMQTGRICLFQGQRTAIAGVPANLDPEYTLYGGGLHLMR